MPTYAYACTACEHRFETVQSFSEDSLTECPECQGRLRKLFNAVGVVFKGSGFYHNDSRNDSRWNSGKTSRGSSGKHSGSRSGEDPHRGSGTTSTSAPSSESGSSSSGSSTSTSSDSSTRAGTTKTAAKPESSAA